MIKKDGKFVHVVIHVDDHDLLCFIYNDSELCMNVYDSISKSFAMKRGPLTFHISTGRPSEVYPPSLLGSFLPH